MVAAYKTLYARLLTNRGIADRIRNKMRYMATPVYRGEYSLLQQIAILWRLAIKGVLPGGVPRIVHFCRTLPVLAPRKLPLVVLDWIAGLAMRDYVERHLLAVVKPHPV
jgi:hypothetical protein